MNTFIPQHARPALPLVIAFLLALTLSACSDNFEEGIYGTAGSNATFEFGPNGQGRLSGAVSNAPSFTYQVNSDHVLISYGQGMPDATLRRIDGRTLERQDGARFVLRE